MTLQLAALQSALQSSCMTIVAIQQQMCQTQAAWTHMTHVTQVGFSKSKASLPNHISPDRKSANLHPDLIQTPPSRTWAWGWSLKRGALLGSPHRMSLHADTANQL